MTRATKRTVTAPKSMAVYWEIMITWARKIFSSRTCCGPEVSRHVTRTDPGRSTSFSDESRRSDNDRTQFDTQTATGRAGTRPGQAQCQLGLVHGSGHCTGHTGHYRSGPCVCRNTGQRAVYWCADDAGWCGATGAGLAHQALERVSAVDAGWRAVSGCGFHRGHQPGCRCVAAHAVVRGNADRRWCPAPVDLVQQPVAARLAMGRAFRLSDGCRRPADRYQLAGQQRLGAGAASWHRSALSWLYGVLRNT